MITKDEAKESVQRWLDSLGSKHGGWLIVDSMTIERPYGWMFFRTTRDFLETKNLRSMPPGNSAKHES